MNAESLKNSILQLAIQGKLVEQREEEGTAEDLYKEIQLEKDKLIKEGKIRRQKKLPEITKEEIPFEIPSNWKWVSLGDVLSILRGGSPRPISSYLTDSEDGINWIKIGDAEKNSKYINATKQKIKREGITKSRLINKGDFLLSNSMSFGRPYISNIEGCIHDGWLVLSDYIKSFNKDYLYYILSSKFVYYQFTSIVTGAVVKNLNIDKVKSTLIPLPPLAEQKRIVEKIEELIPFVERYGKAYEEVTELNKNFPVEMEKSILQYAIQGKLVEQREEEGTAEELYKEIQLEKEKLIEEGEIRRQKKLPEITEEEVPFEIPDTWKWTKFGEIVNFNLGKTPPRSQDKYWGEGYPWVSIADMVDGGYTLKTKEQISELALEERFGQKMVPKDTLLMSFKLTIGKVTILGTDAVHNEAIISVIPFYDNTNIFRDYLFKVLPFMAVFGDSRSAIKGNTLNKTSLNNLLIPLPPLAEQKRIVARIEELLDYTRKLKEE